MSGATLTLREADDDESLSCVESMLEETGLPSRDVRSKPDCFYAGYVDGDAVAVGGIEAYGTAGLLRSVVVAESKRGEGFGTALCDALEGEARAAGVETLFLLTTTAADFFADRGFAEIARSDAPDSVRATTEFEDICPATAVCMKKSL
ncbi:amino-acid N-acetyltransferase [Halopelagius inordinatus]|uniref:Amino-acid N-acetyltransferase n=1 Tax=Halopelagius inordinatus TaxID=553467 RepID=A0A1I2WP80_9EURY|nr:arsenic resistance N-acetyltransferase ArsN2 [Halopelagius inordinatus]SFH03170.1 amino-acid N-acetyltransferase [Halopelagius inordinatus]